MPFIGKQPAVGSFTLLDSITTSATATYALTKNGDAFYPETARNLLVSLNGVTQAPEDAYTVSGSNIVFASALTSSDVIDYILVLGDVLDIGQPSDGTVGVPQMNSALYSENEFFALPTGTTAQRPASPANGYIRYNTTTFSLETYHEASDTWETVSQSPFSASGGTETTITVGAVDYKVHTFTSSGTFTVESGGEVEYIVVAGGGGGGNGDGGGGGAGGYRSSVSGESSGGGASAENALSLSAGTYTITVGAGGAPEAYDSSAGSNGSNSSIGTSIVSIGGGLGGGGAFTTVNGSDGGSGGGSRYPTGALGGSGTSGQGYAGGSTSGTSAGPAFGGSGGGGAGGVGGNGSASVRGNGGSGISSSITGSSVARAGGGGAGGEGGSGGVGAAGGGNGCASVSGCVASSATVNSGSGGGGGGWGPTASSGGAGGSGIVIIRYAI